MTHDDLTEAEAATEALLSAEQLIRDLADRMRRKDDHHRADKLRVLSFRVERCVEEVEKVFA